jgi:MoxR-like ATPase
MPTAPAPPLPLHARSNGHAPPTKLPSSSSPAHSAAPSPPAARARPALSAEEALARARGIAERLRAGLRAVVLGQEEVILGVVMGLLTGGHVLLEGAPGLGKTQIVRTLSRLVGGTFARIQFTPDLMPSDILGTSLVVTTAAGGKDLTYRPGPIFANLVLADEINRATPKTQSALLEAMAERTVSVEGTPRELPCPFFVLATENPIEMEGVFPLPEAQLDRFLMKLIVRMPDLATLTRIGARAEESPPPDAVATTEDLIWAQRIVRMVAAAPHVEAYAAKLVMATHAHKAARYGAGPRAVRGLMACARARALIAGRPAVAASDVAHSARDVLGHRIGMRFDAEAAGTSTDHVIADVVAGTSVE